MQKKRVAILDYGMGNTFSVMNAIRYQGCPAQVTNDSDIIMSADALIFPGVGSFGQALENLEQYNLTPVIRSFINTKRPFLGICLGAQLLLTTSYEYGCHRGLGVIGGEVQHFPSEWNKKSLKVPHIGWKEVSLVRDSILFNGIDSHIPMYFVHSYFCNPLDKNTIFAEASHGGLSFCAGMQKENLFATQFHPEKSGEPGMQLLKNWLDII